MNPNINEIKGNNSSLPNSFMTSDENKSPLVMAAGEAADPFIKHPKFFKVSLEKLVALIQEGEKRTFCEEIDKLNAYGQLFFERALNTNFKTGISQDPSEMKVREEEFGHNRRNARETETFWALLWNALGDFTLRILIVCAIVSVAVEVGMAENDDLRKTAWIDGFAILVAVLLSSSVQAANDYQKEKQFQHLNSIADTKKMVMVYRGGELLSLHHSALVTGDIVQITEGMEVPSDGLVIESSEVQCDESAMTGETEPMIKCVLSECLAKKSEFLSANPDGQSKAGHHEIPSALIYSGSRVLQGEGKFLVLVVGPKSCLGRIQEKLETETESTPLQEKLEHLARGIGKFGLISAIFILAVLIIRFAVERIEQDNFYKEKHWKELIGYLLISITVIVVAIPEGLPLSVVISLAYSVKKMLKDQNLVRRLHACETMGGADMICSDKTGTLTMNLMTLTAFWNEKQISIETFEKAELKKFLPTQNLQDIFLQICIVNSSAILRPEPKGSSTEIAFLKFVEDICSLNYDSIRKQYTITQKFPFNSQRKRMSCIIVEPNILGKKNRLVTKGASEIVLEACSKYHSFQDDEILNMSMELRTKILEAIEKMASQALRTLILAYKDLEENENCSEKDAKGVFAIEKTNFTFFGIVGIKDILRKEVPKAIEICKKAGIKVRMVTGDNKITARAIAKECKIIEPGDENSLVLEGSEFIKLVGGCCCANCPSNPCDCVQDEKSAKALGKKVRKDTIRNPEEFNRIYKHIDVLARSRPEDKYTMVVGLRERNHVVAVTGDGTNDAPALKKADVGFAMGISGTEVAREAAAIILLDDNFESIVKAAMWGRNIYDSIRKFLQFQLTVNLVAVGITLVTSATIKQELFKPVQMLWINLIMDTFASLALATEPPSEKLLERKPHNRNEYMISKKMFKHIIGQAIYQFTVLLVLTFYGENFLPEYEDTYDNQLRNDNMPMSYKYHFKDGNYFVRSGRHRDVSNPEMDEYEFIEKDYGPSRHFTIIFNAFVFMQFFNFLNARRISDEINIFEGITKNTLFLIILFIILLFQGILISHGSIAFHVYKWYDDSLGSAGLSLIQWAICIGIGSGSLLVRLILVLFPENKCLQFGVKRSDPIQNPSKIIEMKRGNSSKKFPSLIQQSNSHHSQGAANRVTSEKKIEVEKIV